MVPLTVVPAPAGVVDPPPAMTLDVTTYGPPLCARAGRGRTIASSSAAAHVTKAPRRAM